MSDEVSLAQQQVSPHGLQVLQQQVITVEDIQQVLAGVEVGRVDLLLERSLQVRQQLCGYVSKKVSNGVSLLATFYTLMNGGLLYKMKKIYETFLKEFFYIRVQNC